MSKETIHRNFGDILTACKTEKCTVPFESLPYEFERIDKTKAILQIIEGQTVELKEKKSNEEEEEKIEFDRTLKITNKHDVSGDENDPKRNDLLEISSFLLQVIKKVFGSATISLDCEFGIQKETEKIYILENSSAESLKDAFTSSLFSDIPNGEQEFQNFMQCATSPDFFEPPCKNPVHKVRKIDIIYYRAHMKFPSVNEYRLYKVIKLRLKDMSPQLLNETINVCLKCSLNYSGARHENRGSKLSNKQFRENDPHVFEALTPYEMEQRRTQSVGYTQDMHKAYCFTVNLRESPYHEAPWSIAVPPKERPKLKKQKELKKSNEKWVKRLTDGEQIGPHPVRIPSEMPVHVEEVEIPEEAPLPPTYSERLAPKAYTNQTFKYEFIDKKKYGGRKPKTATKNKKKTKKEVKKEEDPTQHENKEETQLPNENETEDVPKTDGTENKSSSSSSSSSSNSSRKEKKD